MQVFDHIETREINRLQEMYAVDEAKNEAYLLRNLIVGADSSTLKVTINSIKRRKPFANEESMRQFCNEIMQLANKLVTSH
ncbi:hypothetical protein CRENPOLYSF2_2120008 [Crenothrix polyspora]|uniref:Uncharacterized protein n=1 Tax=Crenothrix polyspora TaxID=360316 RepID=A0A1R4H5V4_9GAMM|nr:hypothetical protein [Crenothrix polyspora]SJM91240.1 hypothetical protein CRENPOLYSF2_2120008 [Crenothrix polyspora]